MDHQHRGSSTYLCAGERIIIGTLSPISKLVRLHHSACSPNSQPWSPISATIVLLERPFEGEWEDEREGAWEDEWESEWEDEWESEWEDECEGG